MGEFAPIHWVIVLGFFALVYFAIRSLTRKSAQPPNSATLLCRHCGKYSAVGSEFCSNCGQKLGA